MKHTAMVPKGFLRLYVLKLLSRKPMSGSEIMQEIENKSRGRWRPSPGSVYPLISWLQDKGYIKEVPTEEAGMKRYTLTDQGNDFLEDQIKRREEMHKRFRFLGPLFSDFFWLELNQKGTQKLQKASQKLVEAVWNLRRNLRENYSEALINEAKDALEEAASKIDEINKRLQP